jgi:signal transduction protein with GAF and PtsI domain
MEGSNSRVPGRRTPYAHLQPPPAARGIIIVVNRVRELEQRLERLEHQLRLLQKISRFMVRDLDLRQSLDSVVQLVVEFMDCDSCLLYLLENDELVLCASNTAHPQSIGKVRLKLSEGLTGWVARERRLLAISREAYHDSRFKMFSELPEDTFEAFLSAPIVFRNGVVGVINVQHRDPHAHTGGEMELLTTVGEQVGCLLELSRCVPAAGSRVDTVLAPGSSTN